MNDINFSIDQLINHQWKQLADNYTQFTDNHAQLADDQGEKRVGRVAMLLVRVCVQH